MPNTEREDIIKLSYDRLDIYGGPKRREMRQKNVLRIVTMMWCFGGDAHVHSFN